MFPNPGEAYNLIGYEIGPYISNITRTSYKSTKEKQKCCKMNYNSKR